ncbi:uncharacterized protein MCYG_00970 [Microsporum canis CBS 113480]|uniref:Uncharacterized protein n=1 Tax=Arthroderma otae (strain ATCC MYA-4605 / CBS 113480) TaxID=554155 RepID=C5FE48_ARTOC|nr:uncharacterized protein MCYG_00970 [Microsporum canis CBS 113480]EEQ28082.1 predicted protein [Microsporum canis CBS 113480]
MRREQEMVEISERSSSRGDMLPLGRRLGLWYASCVISTPSHVCSREIPDNHCVDLISVSHLSPEGDIYIYVRIHACTVQDAHSLTRIGSCHTSARAQGKGSCGTRRGNSEIYPKRSLEIGPG